MITVLCLPAVMLWTMVLKVSAPVSLPVLLAFAAWAAWQVRLGVIGPD
ncbi:MAG: hypothetical protein ACRYGM_16695 [Janthinobacterium lividum]